MYLKKETRSVLTSCWLKGAEFLPGFLPQGSWGASVVWQQQAWRVSVWQHLSLVRLPCSSLFVASISEAISQLKRQNQKVNKRSYSFWMLLIHTCLPKWQQVLQQQHKVVAQVKNSKTGYKLYTQNPKYLLAISYAGIYKGKQTLLSLWWSCDDEDLSLHIYQGNKCQDEA